jgi:hypothetical protein
MIDDADPPIDLDDGATEVVGVRPMRRGGAAIDLPKVVSSRSGGRLAQMRATAIEQSRNFINVRTPLGSARIALSHALVFHTLWRRWTANRAEGLDDPGVSMAELVADGEIDTARARAALAALSRTRIVRVVTQHIGYQGTRSRYYPTELGVQAFAIAEVLGPGSAVQVGRTREAWRGRNLDEPSDLFQFAALLRGGPLPVNSETR